jgi:peptidoglycan/LPS O-acetylase OafA/YrhL
VKSSNKQLFGLDALRGVAILLVVAAHFGGSFTGDSASIVLGNAGVILFFFLSGFLMHWTLSFDRSLVNYAIRRCFRILPMYWVSILLVALVGGDWVWGQLLSNATFTAPVVGSKRMLGVYWTLYIEVLFYCVAPLIFFLGTRAIRFSTYAALTLFIVLASTRDIGAGAPFYMIFCLCGMQMAAWHCGKLAGLELIISVFIVSVFFVLLLPLPYHVGLVPPVCAAFLSIALRLKIRFVPLELLGAVSYSWYLIHTIFGYNYFNGSQLISLLIGTTATLALSIATYHLIERPGIFVGKLLVRQWRPQPALSESDILSTESH